MARFRTLSDIAVKNRTVLVRADLNVPTNAGQVSDASRLTAFLPTLRELSEAGAKIVICSHFGRPKGKKDPAFSLRPVAAALQKLWGKPIAFANDCVGEVALKAITALLPGEALVLENTRFYKEEEANDPAFAHLLATGSDFFVNDAFSAAHRAHASTEGVAKILPSAAGRLMQAELEALSKVLENPARPVMALIGGAKISTKLDLLSNLLQKVDVLVLGGGMANTFLAAKGFDVGKSLCESDMLETARTIIQKAEEQNCRLLLPTDLVVASAFAADAANKNVAITEIPPDQMALDLGTETCAEIEATLETVKTVLWNGPLGAFEIKPFDRATSRIAQKVATLTKAGKILSVAGGGDTVAALVTAHAATDLSYLSMAGGAFLEWLEGKELPGVKALEQA